MTTLYLSLDDTDTHESRGTGYLARQIAARLSQICTVTGVTRHQLYVHEMVPMTSHNSCAVLHLSTNGTSPDEIWELATGMVADAMADGSDPGVALASPGQVTSGVYGFGLAAKGRVVNQREARALAGHAGIRLAGLGGTEDGVIGALAGVGLAASGYDGRYILRGDLRDLTGTGTVQEILDAGADGVMTLDGTPVTRGSVRFTKFPRPVCIGGKAILLVAPSQDGYRDLKVG